MSEDSVSVSTSVDGSEVVTSMTSPSGRYLAVLREISESSSPDKKRYVEVWTADKLRAVENVTDKHGQFYTDGTSINYSIESTLIGIEEFLSSISFSPSETKLVYVAEAKPEEDSSENDPLAKYRFVPELGEAFAGRKKPGIFLFDLSREVGQAVTALSLDSPPPSPPLLCHPIFVSEGKIAALGYEYSDDGRMLGVCYCPNRAAGVWELSLPSDLKSAGNEPLRYTGKKLTLPGLACRSPRVFGQDGRSYILFASNAVGGPHHTCSRIELMDLDNLKTRILLDTVQDPSPTDFPGLYTSSLPAYPFLQPSASTSENLERFLIVSSQWRCRATVLLISLTTGNVSELTPDTGDHWSWTVLCTDGRSQVVCSRSALNKPPELVLGRVDSDARVTWRVLAKPSVSDECT